MKREMKDARAKYDALPDDQRSGEGARKLDKQEARLAYLGEAMGELFAKEMDPDDYAL